MVLGDLRRTTVFMDRWWHFQINYLHFFVVGYLKDTSPVGKDLDFVTTSIEYLF